MKSIQRIMVKSLSILSILAIPFTTIAKNDDTRLKNQNRFGEQHHLKHPLILPKKEREKHSKELEIDATRLISEVRSVDGTYNNDANADWGSTDSELLRLTGVDYADGIHLPAGEDRASARAISNACMAQEGSTPSAVGVSDFFWQWGQFLDHDIDLVPTIDPQESFDILVPIGDPYFDPNSSGSEVIPLDRSYYSIASNVRQQVNEITAYIDASNVYGSDTERALELRTLDGTGRLKTSANGLLPYNVNGFPNAPISEDPSYFLGGDFRANEQVGLTAMHVLFVREHNYWADLFGKNLPSVSGNDIYELARAIVAAEIQSITYNEFLPILLGREGLAPYSGYNPEVNAGISNVFATAAFRLGHSMLSSEILRLDANGETIPNGNLSLANAFFNPDLIIADGIEPILRGLASQVCQEIDPYIVGGVRNFLFGPPGSGGLDLASLNIQRGRDHGLASYNQIRIDFGLTPVTDFTEISSVPKIQGDLASVYTTVDEIDVWVGGLAEDHIPGALVGETFFVILKNQFERLRDGDRFWFQRSLTPYFAKLIEHQTLADIIRRNTDISNELPNHVFIKTQHPQDRDNEIFSRKSESRKGQR